MTKNQLLFNALATQVRESFAAGMPYIEEKPENHIIAQAGGVAFVEKPYRVLWFRVTPPPGANSRMWAVCCKCADPRELKGVTLRPFVFRSPRGPETLLLAQCDECQRVYWCGE